MRKLITAVAAAGMSVGLLAAPAAAAPGQGSADGRDILNKPGCEQLTLLGVGAEWSNDRGIKSCTVTVETRLVDLSYELEEQLLQTGSLPGIRVTVTQSGTLRVTLDVEAVLGASQRGNVGAPGTVGTLEPVLEAVFDLNAWWEECQATVLTEGQLANPFTGNPLGPVFEISDNDVATPDEVCTLAFASSVTGIPVLDLLDLAGVEFDLADLL